MKVSAVADIVDTGKAGIIPADRKTAIREIENIRVDIFSSFHFENEIFDRIVHRITKGYSEVVQKRLWFC
jgi:hypothetical protein